MEKLLKYLGIAALLFLVVTVVMFFLKVGPSYLLWLGIGVFVLWLVLVFLRSQSAKTGQR